MSVWIVLVVLLLRSAPILPTHLQIRKHSCSSVQCLDRYIDEVSEENRIEYMNVIYWFFKMVGITCITSYKYFFPPKLFVDTFISELLCDVLFV